MSTNCLKVAGLLMLLIVQGCAIGYDSILFATKSNIGVDLDTAPPNLEVAISRQEGVIEPVFEGGQTVPVMASFSAKTNAFTKFFWGVSSTFSTGEAAYTMTRLYDWPEVKDLVKDTPEAYKPVTLTKKPSAKSWFGTEKTEYINNKDGDTVRPVLFGTDTSLGVKIKWSGATAQYPSAVNIGFNRKEIAIAPLSLAEIRKDEYTIDVPSLLATIDSDVAVDGGAELSYMQYFATGTAANNLTRQPAVREAMLKRADPGQELQSQKASASKDLRAANRKLIIHIQALHKAAADSNKLQNIAKAKELKLVKEIGIDDKAFFKELADHSDAPPKVTANLFDLEAFAANR